MFYGICCIVKIVFLLSIFLNVAEFLNECGGVIANTPINIDEKKTKRSVETNQATSNLRYELRFNYTLTSIKKDCITYEKEIVSYFSIIPKSSGYNYGTDTSLEKKYELAIGDNLNQFVSILSDINIDNCL